MARNSVQTFADKVAGVWQQTKAALLGGAANAYCIPALGATGQLDVSHMPTGIGPEVVIAPASEAIAAGSYVNYWNNNGVINMRNADASAPAPGKPADGFVLAAVAIGANGTAYGAGQNGQVTGQTPGPVWLSDTAVGQTTSTPPTASGHLVQYLGKAIAANNIATSIDPAPFFLA